MTHIACILLVILSACCVSRTAQGENPPFKEEQISSWFEKLNDPQNSENRRLAQKAILDLGTNSFPFILSEITRLGSEWNRDTTNFCLNPNYLKRVMAIRAAFTTFGTNASPLFPELVNLFNDGMLSDTAAYGLTQINAAEAAKVFSNTLMTNKSAFIQCVAVNNLSLLGTNAVPAIPALIQCLDAMGDSADLFGLRRLALVELGQIGKQPDIVVPALIRSLKKENSFILRVAAINSLESYAKDNPSAYAELVAASTEDNELHVKTAAKSALSKLPKI
jgi:hypothetical protein